MIIETKKLSELKPAPYNPRKSNEKQEAHLKASLEKFGVVEPIIFNKQTGYIVGGHFRVRELKKLGYKEIDCVIVDLNEQDEKELNIRLNANTGDWDFEELAEWDEPLEEWGLDVPKDKDKSEEDLFDIEIPFYRPSEIKPDINELANINKTNDLKTKIDLLDCEDGLKEILKNRASFFTDFNFQKIADFYAKSDKETKCLFEDLGMVILAPKEALKKGFIEMSENIFEL
jgi:hypothetical protein